MPNNDSADILEAKKRLESLPENLKKEILADKNVQLISNICRDYSIPDEKVKHIALLVGEVFLGYIKPEEVSSELNTYFDIELQKSNFIEIELKQKLFNPLKADLEKIYNPLKISAEEETEKSEEEFAPTIIKPEIEAPAIEITTTPISIANAPIQTTSIINQQPFDRAQGKPFDGTQDKPTTNNQPQKISPLTIGSIPVQPIKTETPSPVSFPKSESAPQEAPFGQAPSLREASAGGQDKPFIIQTKVEAVKRAMPQFPKETPSISLKIDESILEKPSAIKPVSVRLETEQPGDAGIKFKMPVKTDQRPTIIKKEQPAPVLSKQTIEQKPIFKLNLSQEQPPRVVHYSDFKTPLTNTGIPKKPKPKKEDMINLTTFTKINGNTVDLRKSTD